MSNSLSNLNAERSVLAAALLAAEKIMPFAVNQKNLLPVAFQHPPHAYLWKVLMDMSSEKLPIDVLTLSENLRKNRGLEKVGGMEYLSGLLDAIPTESHAEYYIDIVCQRQTKRHLAKLSTDLLQATKEENLNECHRLNTIIQTELENYFNTSTEMERFPAWHYNDLLAYKVPEGHIIAGRGWLRRGAGCLLTGGTSLGKSVLAEQIAVSVAGGINILGCIGVPSPMRVTYLQAENDEETLQRDIISIVKYIQADPTLIQQNLAIHHLYGLSGSALDRWIETQIIKQKTDLLILDPYQDFIPSGANINDAGTFLTFIFDLNRIIKDHNCAFLLVTHTPKPQDREHWTARESVYLAVGSQAIAAWARTSAEITGYKDDDTKYRLRFGKNAERNGIAHPDGSGGLVRDLMIQHSPSIHEPYWQVSESQSSPQPNSEIGRKIITLAIQSPSLTYRDIAEQLGCSKSVVGKWYPKDV